MRTRVFALAVLTMLSLTISCTRSAPPPTPEVAVRPCGAAVGYVPCGTAESKGETVEPAYLMGTTFTGQQQACLAKLPPDHAGCEIKVYKAIKRHDAWVLGDEIRDRRILIPAPPARPLDERKAAIDAPGLFNLRGWLRVPSAMAQGYGTVTFHNPGVGGFGGSLKMFFREPVFLASSKDPDYYQHAHGNLHSLYVVERKNGSAPATVTLYPLEFGDTIDVYTGKATDPVVAADVANHVSKIQLEQGKPEDTSACSHAGHTHDEPFYKWHVTMDQVKILSAATKTPDVFKAPNGEDVGFPTLQHTVLDASSQTAPGVLRRLVVRTPQNTIRYDLPLAACSAFQTCARPSDSACADVPLCRIDIDKMIGTCERCAQLVGK